MLDPRDGESLVKFYLRVVDDVFRRNGFVVMKDKLLQERSADPIDRRTQYTDASPEKLRDQLNENFRKLRLLELAIKDRNKIIGDLHGAVLIRDEAIERLNGRLRYAKLKLALLYSIVGGASAEGIKVAALAAIRMFVHH